MPELFSIGWEIDGVGITANDQDASKPFRMKSNVNLEPNKEDSKWHCVEVYYKPKENKMYIYFVVAVDKETNTYIDDNVFVAQDEEMAKMMMLASLMREKQLTDESIANYHFAVEQIGEGYSEIDH
jgi:hypothetical protein